MSINMKADNSVRMKIMKIKNV